MKINRKIVTILLISFLTFSILSILGGQTSLVDAQLGPEVRPGYGASLTGNVSDEGVDTDGDGLFDYLQISVEVNVTSPWMLYSVEVYQLVDPEASYSKYIYVQQSAIVYPKTGLQLVNVSLFGPTIYNSGLNPKKIFQITLSETSLFSILGLSYPYSLYYDLRSNVAAPYYGNIIDSLNDLPLSKEYSYTEFDPPFTGVEAKFVVYPDGRVVIGGEVNYTPTMSLFAGMPSLKGLITHGDASLTSTGLLTVISQNNTVLLPPEYASKFPLNSTTISMLETYSGDVLNTGTNCTMILPPYIASEFPFNSTDASLSITYSEGLFTTEIDYSTTVPMSILPPDFEVPPGSEQLFDFVHFLLNSTDVSIVGEYLNGELSGNITISMLPGFALGNLDINFQGNQTYFSLSGDTRVFYGSFYGIELDEETLDMILLQLNSTIIGEGPGSLYDLTEGALNCTKLTTAKTPVTDPLPGANIHFEMDIKGHFVKAVANSISSALMPPLHFESLLYHATALMENLKPLIYEEADLANETIFSLEDLAEAIPEEEERIYEIIASLEDLMILIDEEEVRIDEIVDSLEYLVRLITGEEKDEIAEEISVVIVSLDDLLHACMNETQHIREIVASLEGLAEVVPEEQREQIYDLIESLGDLMYLTDQKVELVYWSIDSLERLPEYIAQEEERERMRASIYSALNATVSSVQTTSFELEYIHSTRQASMEFTFVDDVRSLVDELLPLVPPIHPLIPETLPDILNKTFSCTKTASVQMAYTKTDGRFDFQTIALAEGLEQVREELTQLIVEILQNATLIPPEIMPTEMRTLVESLLNTTYCSLESYESSLTYENGRQDGRETYTIQDDLNAELNYVKDIYLQYMLAFYSRYHMPMPWQLSFVNQTEMDIRNLRVSYNFTEPLMTGSIEGFGIWPPIDVINATRFQLRGFFNLTREMGPYEPPRKGERLKITIEGGSNITHQTIPFRPPTVPEPDETTSDMRRMVWYNQTLSSLMDMMFDIQIVPGVGEFEIVNPELISEANPYVANATKNAATIVEITRISKPAKLYVANLTEPPEGVESPPGTYKVLGKYVCIQCTETDVDMNATIRMYYTPEQLSAAGLDENTLKIHCWNSTLGEWVPIETQVNTSEHCAWATICHFSTWALMGQPSAAPIWSEPWFWIVTVTIVFVVMVIAAYAIMRKRSPPQESATTKTEK